MGIPSGPRAADLIDHDVALRDLLGRSELLAEICELAERAFADADLDAVLELALHARQARAAVAGANQRVAAASTGAGDVSIIARLASAAGRAQPGNDLLRQWSERPPPGADALGSGHGVVAFTEAMLPLTWDFDADVVLLFGRGLEPVAEVLLRCGQRRVVVHAPELVDLAGYPDGVVRVRDEMALYHAIAELPSPRPRQLAARGLDEADLSFDAQREAVERASAALTFNRVSENTVGVFAEMWVAQGLANLPHIASLPSVAAVGDSLRGRPMLIIAPGPSLDRNIQLAHQWKGKAVIATFSHTLTALLAANLVPDLVITVDANALQYHFKGYPLERVAAMVSGATVNPDLFEMPAPRHLILGSNAGVDDWLARLLGEQMVVPGGGSVATTAASLAVRWGCDPIVFIGLDLSFSDGRYYAASSCDSQLRVRPLGDGGAYVLEGWSDGVLAMRAKNGQFNSDVEESFDLPGYHGGRVPTSRMFALFHDWFVSMARHVQGQASVINATEGGAYIEGMEHISLADAHARFIADAPDLDVAGLLDRAIAGIDLAARRRDVAAGCTAMLGELRKARRNARRCDQLAARVATDARAERELARHERALGRGLAGVHFLSILGQAAIDRASDRARNTVGCADLLAASRELYATIIATIDRVLPGLEDAIRRLGGER